MSLNASTNQLQYHVSKSSNTLFLFVIFTVSKGQSANMLKVGSKRRRTKAQVEADTEEAELLK